MRDSGNGKNRIEAVIFDWAGTTIDYGCFAPLKGFMDGFGTKGVKITAAEARKPMGMLKLDHVRAIARMERVREVYERENGHLPKEEDIQEIYGVFKHTLMDNILSYTDVKPGVCETVEELRAGGIRIGSTTGYTREMMDKILDRVKEKGYCPDACFCADEVPAGRPYPYMMWKNMTALSVSDPHHVVKVGDTVADIKEGISAGAWTVGVILGSSELGMTEAEVRALTEDELEKEIHRVEKVFYKAGADYVISDMKRLPEIIEKINGRLEQMAPYRLLTPGPLTTRRCVKEAMLKDHCTWDEEYKAITRSVMEDITSISANREHYAAVLLQGSGSYAVEAMIQCFCRDEDKLLILANGAYGERMVSEAKLAGKKYEVLSFDPVHSLRPQALEEKLKVDPRIQTVMFVHSETTSGLINPVKELAQVAKAYGKTVLVDAMSSFGAYEIDMEGWGIDALAASANKCLEGVPGLSFVVARKILLEGSKGISKSLCLDLYGQYDGLYRGGGKFRFTSPTHVLLALRQALDEYKREGGLEGRRERYMENHRTLMRRMKQLGIESIVPEKDQSYIITTFHLGDLDFEGLYQYLKRQGFVIYPGKLTDLPTFRIGTIGDIYPSDMEELADAIAAYKHGAWWQ